MRLISIKDVGAIARYRRDARDFPAGTLSAPGPDDGKLMVSDNRPWPLFRITGSVTAGGESYVFGGSLFLPKRDDPLGVVFEFWSSWPDHDVYINFGEGSGRFDVYIQWDSWEPALNWLGAFYRRDAEGGMIGEYAFHSQDGSGEFTNNITKVEVIE